ncbi:enoyl-CoA hydratase/isomerase family protein [Jatrophihabitans cynanchi]|uniref:Enoyl-CoA hydratase/isomerase family protein n=1 Tax=Jatrophihabitans cynanchi TaxID=2944128 RepID=A0ABY7K3K0_9ACTN|nr:enoyl-CoA hydratase/isomerase family protein [Jatrophihabitans sp. SB3-54]WAX58483.1 enoyl-CoA hydratase/isomerase family protein [Jatrophihabitans sp. SB3-54]
MPFEAAPHYQLDDVDGVAAWVTEVPIAVVELRRPPNNFFDLALIQRLTALYESFGDDGSTRAIVLCAAGKHFCAGSDFGSTAVTARARAELYEAALGLFATPLPVVAAVHGAAIGGGLGLACSADFRVTSRAARFSANFAQLGFHHGFALSMTLPALVGQQHARELLYTGRRIDGADAVRIGLADRLAAPEDVRRSAFALAAEIAASAPLAVRAIRRTLRTPFLITVEQALDHEAVEQARLEYTDDFAEGVRASLERRPPRFSGS